ncbi:sodium/proton antiporter, CPA1 family (TC 2.A.36) [Paenibacillus sp. 1_12]|uniref:Na+/H+ antiporter n=1 Tax=Paenibacillus sp. 1_12 TaxID=1566278 RepID=UPI0008E213A4|nr:Na+/H+ antiporter [Paenibacillus sp. 1_12]SFK70993.1 sodium/proton antiporter, CPA1 family (TC 2.A.36) [Paenibacillus sp. 1_12]
MELFLIVLLLLVLIGLSMILNRFVPFIPVPLFQVALGMLAAVIPWGIHIPLSPELFFVLFVAPLLFNDGKRIPREELWNLRAPILLLSLGLVFATVFVGGYVIHWLLPAIPLSAAFALAAILSPTDAVAVGALSGKIRMPKKITHLLEGEALMNDASGLVAFKFAVAATVSGLFSFPEATASFFLISIGGLLVGCLLSFLIIRLRVFIRQLGMEDTTIHMLIQILTPFLIYLVAEEFGVSGILAAVTGGIIHAIERDRSESNLMELKIVSVSTWTMILFILNGLVFLILGLQIPNVAEVVIKDLTISNVQMLVYIILISITLIALRFVWVYGFWRAESSFSKKEHIGKPQLRPALLIAISGVRGTITLAGAFSIPLFLQDGTPFPERNVIIFLAAGVILISLVTASVLLPLLSDKPDKGKERDKQRLEQDAKIQLLEASILMVKEEMNEENQDAALSLISDYNKHIQQIRSDGLVSEIHFRKIEREIRLFALSAERREVKRLVDEGSLNQVDAFTLTQLLNRSEMLVTRRLQYMLRLALFMLKRLAWKVFIGGRKMSRPLPVEQFEVLKAAKLLTSKAAITAIKNHINPENKNAAQEVISNYRQSMQKLNSIFKPAPSYEEFKKHKKELQYKAIQLNRNSIQSLFQNGEINRGLANQLRQFVSFLEVSILVDEEIG